MIGAKRATKSELAHMGACKRRPCVICTIRCSLGLLAADKVFRYGQFHHCKSGNIRRGHLLGFCMCDWHHNGNPPQGYTNARAFQIWGVPLAGRFGGSALFHATYGSDDELIEVQAYLLEHAEEFHGDV